MISYVSILTRDVGVLPSFYSDVFGLPEILSSRSDRYRELDAGTLKLGFPFIDAYDHLQLQAYSQPQGIRSLLTFSAADPGQVDAWTDAAVGKGAQLARPGFRTGFGQYLSVLLDPEGNALRISAAADPLTPADDPFGR